jgi:TRAP-type C4-dicarboxylate transport system substrate-binding protein
MTADSDGSDRAIAATRRGVLASLGALALAAPWIAGRRLALEEPITLRYTSHTSRAHGIYTHGFVPFAELVERETHGRLRLEAFTDSVLHGAADGFKAATAGITDYTHSYIAYQPGSFKLLHAPQLPFLFPSPQVACLVIEQLYPRYFKAEFERMGVYLAHCDCTSPYNILSKAPLRRLEDLRGVKVRAPGGPVAEIFRELGAVPVAIAVSETYVALQRGIVDAVAISAPDMVSYRLHEIGSFYTRADLNLLALQFCLNRRTFDALPEDLRAILYRTLRVRSQMAVQNYYSGAGYERALTILRDAGVEAIELDEDERERWRRAVTPLTERFVAAREAEGLPARALISDLRALAAEYAALDNAKLSERVRNSPILGIIDL